MADGHERDTQTMSDARLVGAMVANMLLTVAQIAGGIVAGSLSLVADALHNLNDAASLVIALVARRVARRPATRQHTFGHRRAGVIGALINLTALIIVGLYLVYEAVLRYFDPQDVDGWIVVVIAGIALAVDVVTAGLTYAMSKRSLNIRAAFVHNVSDALASVGVILAGTLILLYELYVVDVLVTVLIAGYILYQGVTMIRQSIRILMESVPEDLDLGEVVREIRAAEGVRDVHHVHVWQLDEQHRALEAHVVVANDDFAEMERIKQVVKERLAQEFEIHHSTLELECRPDRPEAREHDRSLVPRH